MDATEIRLLKANTLIKRIGRQYPEQPLIALNQRTNDKASIVWTRTVGESGTERGTGKSNDPRPDK